jgi:hypothetical protein
MVSERKSSGRRADCRTSRIAHNSTREFAQGVGAEGMVGSSGRTENPSGLFAEFGRRAGNAHAGLPHSLQTRQLKRIILEFAAVFSAIGIAGMDVVLLELNTFCYACCTLVAAPGGTGAEG